MKRHKLVPCAMLALLWLVGCDGQQYVSPDTVALSVTKDSTSSVRLSKCNYVPVLLGSEVDATYDVDGAFQATVNITRDSVTLTFGGDASGTAPFVVAAKDVQDAEQTADNSPAGYTVTLGSGCTVETP